MEYTKGEPPLSEHNNYDCSVCDTEPEGCPGCGSAAYQAGKETQRVADMVWYEPRAEEMRGVLRQFIRYCQQWQETNREFPNGDGRVLILDNATKALAKAEA